ncbi:DUF3800 domain-containing protein [Ramlibacter sp. 2FC]|uniref:DUF3800 domain-containing protein n=1 Tax=Ramlibacter sp. 2FC TaxID=2502188 RepID=UPI0010F84CF1|nr:DUF3800 domain-containing protein [Ramlibacter sp. 2FC]
MNDMTGTHFFVDEAGDATLFAKGGKVVVATEGCSRFFIEGKPECRDVDALKADLDSLRAEVLADPYFKGVPSLDPARQRTAVNFHTKDHAGLQAVDYYLWALQRFYERGETRYLDFIWPQTLEVLDLDAKPPKKRGQRADDFVVFNKEHPLTLASRAGVGNKDREI